MSAGVVLATAITAVATQAYCTRVCGQSTWAVTLVSLVTLVRKLSLLEPVLKTFLLLDISTHLGPIFLSKIRPKLSTIISSSEPPQKKGNSVA